MSQSVRSESTPRERFRDYAREQTERALSAIEDDQATDLDVLAALELALMAAMYWIDGDDARVVTLDPQGVVEFVNEPEPQCICPPSLVARGGFRSGCPVHA